MSSHSSYLPNKSKPVHDYPDLISKKTQRVVTRASTKYEGCKTEVFVQFNNPEAFGVPVLFQNDLNGKDELINQGR